MNIPELLAPAGDLDKLRAALRFGADAVYLGGEQFGLRAMAGNFSIEKMNEAVSITHAAGKRLFLTLNAYLFPGEFGSLDDYLEELRPLCLDAYIVADPAVLARVRAVDPAREIHLSTQANTTSGAAAEFWRGNGVARVNLARELTLEEIAAVRRETSCGLEVFVHGAMCVAFSGRCLLSTSLTGRSANSGACAQPCRWEYSLMEKSRPGEYFPVEEDARGTYIMNSRDLCLARRVPELIRAGVDSLKIEGRMKTLYYVAAVTRIYREILDRYAADPEGFRFDEGWIEELEKVSHRPHAEGFLDGRNEARIFPDDSQYRRTHDFIGVVRSVDSDGKGVVEVRTRFAPGDQLEMIGPTMREARFFAQRFTREDGSERPLAQPNDRILMDLPAGTQAGDLLRRGK